MSGDSDEVIESVFQPHSTDREQNIDSTLLICHPLTWFTGRVHILQAQQVLPHCGRHLLHSVLCHTNKSQEILANANVKRATAVTI